MTATRVSVELVPRSEASLESDLARLRERFPALDTVNVPDLLRFELRSTRACALAKRSIAHAIPHLRAMDYDRVGAFALAAALRSAGLDEVIVVQGDPPQDLARRVYPTRSVDLIRGLKHDLPGVRVLAAFDPYRSGLREEAEYARAKLEAGADGFFTQPFFDLRLAEICRDLLGPAEVWLGVSPVLTPAQRRYWEIKNRAFAKDCLALARSTGANLYFMPIRVDVMSYLDGVL